MLSSGDHLSGRGAAQRSRGSVPLPDPATVVVVGGGPAGSFFTLRLLRRARQCDRAVRVVILEKKSEICFYQPEPFCSWEGCNYCAGGISPRLADILQDEGIVLPDDIVESRADEVVVHGDWKSVRLTVPEGRKMLSVFRGSRPRQRTGRYVNFDSYLLQTAIAEGAEVITGEAVHVVCGPEGKPVVGYRTATAGGGPAEAAPAGDQTVEADFAVFAGGVNRSQGMDLSADPLFLGLQAMIPGLRPPRVRPTLISEMRADGGDPEAEADT